MFTLFSQHGNAGRYDNVDDACRDARLWVRDLPVGDTVTVRDEDSGDEILMTRLADDSISVTP